MVNNDNNNEMKRGIKNLKFQVFFSMTQYTSIIYPTLLNMSISDTYENVNVYLTSLQIIHQKVS